MRSIRWSLLVGTVLGSIVVLVVAGVLLHQAVRSILVQQFDSSLDEKARFLASSIEEVDGEVEVDFEDLDMHEFDPGGGGYLQIWLTEGEELYRSLSLGDGELETAVAGIDEPAYEWVVLTLDEGELRGVTLRFHPHVDIDDVEGADVGAGDDRPLSDHAVTIVMAREPVPIDLFLARLRAALITIGLLTALAAAIVLSIVIHRSLKPLDRLAHEIAVHDSTDMAARIQLSAAPREVSPVVSQLNNLLGRLEAALRRERTFSADMAHELRTPLSGLRSTIEVALSRPRNVEEYQETLAENLEIVQAAQKIVQTLLYMHRLDSDNFETEMTRVDLAELIRLSWNSLSKAADERDIDVQWELEPGLFVTTDPVLLGAAIRNLLDNAVSYSDRGGFVRIECGRLGDNTRLCIRNSGSDVAPEQIAELKERFTRARGLRDPSGSHAGLGLAIVSKIAEILDVDTNIRSQVGGEFEVVLSW